MLSQRDIRSQNHKIIAEVLSLKCQCQRQCKTILATIATLAMVPWATQLQILIASIFCRNAQGVKASSAIVAK